MSQITLKEMLMNIDDDDSTGDSGASGDGVDDSDGCGCGGGVSTYLRCFSCWQLWQACLVTSTGTNISSKIKDDKRGKTSRYDLEL